MKLFILLTIFSFASAATFVSNTVDKLNDAITIIDVELEAVNSGRYSYYKTATIRSIIANLELKLHQAARSSESDVTIDLINMVQLKLDEEREYSYEKNKYFLRSTELIMLHSKRILEIARKNAI